MLKVFNHNDDSQYFATVQGAEVYDYEKKDSGCSDTAEAQTRLCYVFHILSNICGALEVVVFTSVRLHDRSSVVHSSEYLRLDICRLAMD